MGDHQAPQGRSRCQARKDFQRHQQGNYPCRQGWGKDPEFNPRLRTLISKAKQANMPADNIDRAIKKGTGELGGVTIEELLYEGYGPGGVGLIVEVTTDNKNRSASEVRSTFSKGGGNLAGAGALAFNFKRKGQFLLARDKMDEDSLTELALENDAEDVIAEKEHYEVICETSQYDKLAEAFSEKDISPDSSELAYLPENQISVTDEDVARKVLKLIETLEDLEDVKAVHSNYDIDEALLESIAG